MPELEKILLKWMPVAAKAYLKENGGPAVFDVKEDGTYDALRLREIVRNIMYENGSTFIKNWMKGNY